MVDGPGESVDESLTQVIHRLCMAKGASAMAERPTSVVSPYERAMSSLENQAALAADSSKRVRFIPLGGLGEIGMNCFAIEQNDGILVVDCGITFPEDDVGVDVLHPDFSWLLENENRIAGIFITHGHEDHIGALPHLMSQLRATPPIFAPEHCCILLASRFKERGLNTDCLVRVRPREVHPVGPFCVEPVAVSHSIVDATALRIGTSAGHIVHTGDFNLDAHQPAGVPTDATRLQEWGESGVRLLLSDSTNVDSATRKGSEGDVARALAELVTGAEGRLVVGMFSSNVHRLAALVKIAEETRRKLCFLGRSLERQVAAATAIGRLEHSSDALVSREELAFLDRRAVLVVAGGSQAEASSSLRRLSLGTHQHLQLERGDRVILSSRIIPGNERPVLRMINDLLRQGVDVRTSRTDPGVHTSGHAGRDELRQMLRWLRPRAFVPVHGTLHHLLSHERLAKEEGVVETCVVENGETVEVGAAGIRRGGVVPHGVVRIAMGGHMLDEASRKRRQELSRSGVVFISIVLGLRGEVDLGAQVRILGIPGLDDEPRKLDLVARDAETAARRHQARAMLSLEETVRRAARRTIVELTGIRPLIEVLVVRN